MTANIKEGQLVRTSIFGEQITGLVMNASDPVATSSQVRIISHEGKPVRVWSEEIDEVLAEAEDVPDILVRQILSDTTTIVKTRYSQ